MPTTLDIPMMAWIYRMASGIRASNKPPYFIPLFGNVMVGFAEALEITGIPELRRVPFVGLNVIDNLSRYNSASILAQMAKRMTPKLARA